MINVLWYDLAVIIVVLEMFQDNHSILEFLGVIKRLARLVNARESSFFPQDNKTKASNFNATKWIQLIQSHILKSENETNEVTKKYSFIKHQDNNVALIADY